ncbi:MAG: hypothetical protein AB7G48_02910 [Nitrospiraceae bacterium]
MLPSDGQMQEPLGFEPAEIRLLADRAFFTTKARISRRIRSTLERLRALLQDEVSQTTLLAPPGFEPTKSQFVKGEHLEACPYQYLDYPKHFAGDETFTFRTLVWWGHHVACAWLLGGRLVPMYKQRLIDRYQDLAGQNLELSLAPTLWEWKRGEGYTLPLLPSSRAQAAAVLERRTSIKIAKFVPLDDASLQDGRLAEAGCEAFRRLLPLVLE